MKKYETLRKFIYFSGRKQKNLVFPSSNILCHANQHFKSLDRSVNTFFYFIFTPDLLQCQQTRKRALKKGCRLKTFRNKCALRRLLQVPIGNNIVSNAVLCIYSILSTIFAIRIFIHRHIFALFHMFRIYLIISNTQRLFKIKNNCFHFPHSKVPLEFSVYRLYVIDTKYILLFLAC